jgi:hypothetical protein
MFLEQSKNILAEFDEKIKSNIDKLKKEAA